MNKYERKEKGFVQLLKRSREIDDEIRRIPYKELKEPFQEGWLIDLILIPEALRRSDAQRMAVALELCNRTFTLKQGSFEKVTKIRKNPLFAYCQDYFTHITHDGRRVYKGPELYPLKEKEWSKLHESIQKFFRKRVREQVSRWGGATHQTVDYVLAIPNHYIQMKIRKRILTKVQDINPTLLKEAAFIDAKLEEYWRTCPYKSNWYDDKNEPSTKRRHVKDALTHLKKGEIETMNEYHKLNR